MKEKTNKTGVFTVGATHLLHDIYSSFLSPILPYLIEKHQLTKTMCGLLSAAGRFPSAFNAFVGILADKWNLKMFNFINSCHHGNCNELVLELQIRSSHFLYF